MVGLFNVSHTARYAINTEKIIFGFNSAIKIGGKSFCGFNSAIKAKTNLIKNLNESGKALQL